MPIAVVLDTKKRYDLKTLPDGYVVIRRMNFGESLKRKDMMASVAMEISGKKGKTQDETTKMHMDILAEKTTLWEFAELILEHNLTDEHNKPLDFRQPAHVKRIVGQIGDEISLYINELNSFEEDAEVKN
jgi:hypothetical protein